MGLPNGPFLTGQSAIDTFSTNLVCNFEPKVITPRLVSPNVYVNKIPVPIIADGQVDVLLGSKAVQIPDPVTFAARKIFCAFPKARTVKTQRNTTVSINKLKPAVIPGDFTQVEGSERPILSPPLGGNVFIASKANQL